MPSGVSTKKKRGEGEVPREVKQRSAPTLLVAIGDSDLRDRLDTSLRADGYHTYTTADGEAALHIAGEHPLSLVLLALDLTHPLRDGLEVCRLLRMQQKTAYVPILMLATHSDETETIVGLEVGADDYVTSPFHWKVLRARIRALLRRSTYRRSRARSAEEVHHDEADLHEQVQVLVSGNMRIDLAGRNVLLCNQPIELSARLFDLLVYLVHHRGAVVARKDLMEQVHIDVLAGDARLVDVYVHWLREKLEDDPAHPRRLQTVRGIGYRFIG